MHNIANFGSDATLWIEPWADKIVAVRNYGQPFRVQPWKAQPEIELVGRCAKLCGAWLMGVCWTTIFKEQPPFATIHGAENFNQAVEHFIKQHRSKLTKRVRLLAEKVDYPAWQTLAETMEIERVSLLTAFQQKPPLQSSRTWHEAGATPPSDYPAGPLTGTKGQLVKWIIKKTDHRLLNKPLRDGTYWARQDAKELCSIWFKKHERYSEANGKRLADQS